MEQEDNEYKDDQDTYNQDKDEQIDQDNLEPKELTEEELSKQMEQMNLESQSISCEKEANIVLNNMSSYRNSVKYKDFNHLYLLKRIHEILVNIIQSHLTESRLVYVQNYCKIVECITHKLSTQSDHLKMYQDSVKTSILDDKIICVFIYNICMSISKDNMLLDAKQTVDQFRSEKWSITLKTYKNNSFIKQVFKDKDVFNELVLSVSNELYTNESYDIELMDFSDLGIHDTSDIHKSRIYAIVYAILHIDHVYKSLNIPMKDYFDSLYDVIYTILISDIKVIYDIVSSDLIIPDKYKKYVEKWNIKQQ